MFFIVLNFCLTICFLLNVRWLHRAFCSPFVIPYVKCRCRAQPLPVNAVSLKEYLHKYYCHEKYYLPHCCRVRPVIRTV